MEKEEVPIELKINKRGQEKREKRKGKEER